MCTAVGRLVAALGTNTGSGLLHCRGTDAGVASSAGSSSSCAPQSPALTSPRQPQNLNIAFPLGVFGRISGGGVSLAGFSVHLMAREGQTCFVVKKSGTVWDLSYVTPKALLTCQVSLLTRALGTSEGFYSAFKNLASFRTLYREGTTR